ncbi:MAG: carboxypeptidase-like regulatory domain-containing protein [Vicinamibacteria bacterium]
MQSPTIRILAALLTSAAFGCATKSAVSKPNEARPGEARGAETADDEPKHGEISFPRPERETCTPKARTPYRLSVRVRGVDGGAFSGAPVHLFPMGAGKETLATVRTNSSGVANVVVDPPGVYAVTVAVGGFEPQVRALTLRAGCGGSTTFTLKLGPVAGQK